MRRQLVTGLLMTLCLTVLVGLAYPLAVFGVGQVAFGDRVDGSTVRDADGRVVGSSLLGQSFGEFDVDLDCFARPNHATKLDIVESRNDRHVIGFNRDQFRNQDGSRLKTGLALQHPREHRKIRVVPLKYREAFR